MKRITECLANPSNGLAQGVMNHYTPIDNIIINVRNFFGSMLGLYVSKAEDGVSLKITSSQFSDKFRTADIIANSSFDGHTRLGEYIKNLGLPVMKIVELGGYCIVYFCPNDMPSIATTGKAKAVKEMKESLIIEAELSNGVEKQYNSDDNNNNDNTINTKTAVDNNQINQNGIEVELEDQTHNEIVEIVNKQNKIEAASELEELLAKKLQLPENVYIKATKDIEGHESIALRWKLERKRPFGGKIQQSVSLLNIYNTGTNAIWVGAFDEMFGKLPSEIEDLIYNVLDILGANKTGEVEIYDLPENKEDIKKEDRKKKEEDDKKDKNNDDDKKDGDENNKEDDEKKKEDNTKDDDDNK